MSRETSRLGFDAEAVREYLPAYEAIRAGLDAAGKYPYNSEFEGKIPGLAGTPDDKRGVYLLQTLHTLDAERARLAEFVASGGFPASELDSEKPFRGTVVELGFYMGGTGWRKRDDVRLAFRNGKPYAVMPPKARTRGFLLEGTVYVRPVS